MVFYLFFNYWGNDIEKNCAVCMFISFTLHDIFMTSVIMMLGKLKVKVLKLPMQGHMTVCKK